MEPGVHESLCHSKIVSFEGITGFFVASEIHTCVCVLLFVTSIPKCTPAVCSPVQGPCGDLLD